VKVLKVLKVKSCFSNGFDGEFGIEGFEDSFIPILMIGVVSVVDVSAFHHVLDCVLEIVFHLPVLAHGLAQLVSVF
jgi:hypothetical protein